MSQRKRQTGALAMTTFNFISADRKTCYSGERNVVLASIRQYSPASSKFHAREDMASSFRGENRWKVYETSNYFEGEQFVGWMSEGA